MSELTKEASEARDLAVRRALELLYRDDLFFIPTEERPVAETLEERAAVLHYVMDHIYTNAFGFNELVHIPSEHDYRNGVAQLEALTVAPWEGTPENLCLRALAMRSIATARKRLGDVNGSLAALREAAKLAANAGPELQVERCHILRRLSDILSERGEMEESTTLAMEAARLAATVRPEELREGCDILRQLSEILSKNGELGKSTILATESAKLITTIRPEELEIGCFILRDLLEILSKNGALAESLNVAVSAVEIAERIDRASGEAYYHRIPELPGALLQLAEVHHQRGELEAAEAALLRAKAIWEAFPPPWTKEDVGTYLHKLACIREDMGDTAGSIALHLETVAFWRNKVAELSMDFSKDKHKLALALGNLGLALAKDGQRHAACLALEEALVRYDSLYRHKPLVAMQDPDASGFAAKFKECCDALWKERGT